MKDASPAPRTVPGVRLWAIPKLLWLLFTMAGGLAIRALMLHDGRWPCLVCGAGLGLLATGLTSCMSYDEQADWYHRCGPTETIRTGWLTESEYQTISAEQRARGCYPVTIKAAISPSAEPLRLYRVIFKPHPDNITDWRATIAKLPAQDEALNTVFMSQGYTRIWHDDVTDVTGVHCVQSIWVLAR